MKEFLYDEKTVEFFKDLVNRPPKRIFVERSLPSLHVGFDFGGNHILATPKDHAAASQNTFDEVIRVEFAETISPYNAQESEHVILENPVISRVFVVRTLLYFSNEQKYRSKDEAAASLTKEEKADPILSGLLSEATGGHEEIVCNPRSKEAIEVDKRFANLVDAGILLEVDGQYLGCFSNGNGFTACGHIWSREEIAGEVEPFYELIEVKP